MYVFSFKSIYEATSVQPVIAINRRNSEMFGISHADAVGLKTTDYYADISHRERLREPLEKTGKADNILLHLKKPNGETFWARASARLITWDNEQAVLTLIEDISTPRKPTSITCGVPLTSQGIARFQR